MPLLSFPNCVQNVYVFLQTFHDDVQFGDQFVVDNLDSIDVLQELDEPLGDHSVTIIIGTFFERIMLMAEEYDFLSNLDDIHGFLDQLKVISKLETEVVSQGIQVTLHSLIE